MKNLLMVYVIALSFLYTVHLLSFRTGIIKSICMKEMTLLLLSFQHTSLLTVHTDLHSYAASGCLCRSRPLQWCLMYLSWLSGCPKSSQRDASSSGISLLGTKSNQQVLNLANTEGGRAQSLFVGPKTAWWLSRCGTGSCRAKGTSRQIHLCSTLHWWFHCLEQILCGLHLANWRKSPTWSSHETSEIAVFRPWRGFSYPCSGLTFSGRIVGKTPRLIASYSLLKEVRSTVCCGNQILASCNSVVFLLWSRRVWNKARTNLPFSQIFNYSLSHCVLANVHLVC